jgi:hypothetical protein
VGRAAARECSLCSLEVFEVTTKGYTEKEKTKGALKLNSAIYNQAISMKMQERFMPEYPI